MEEQTQTPFEMRLSDVPSVPSPPLNLTYATCIPSNGAVFTQSQQVRLPINAPAESFVDLKRAYMKFTIKNTSGEKQYLDPVIGGATVIDTWRVVGGTGALLEEVQHYNAYYAMLKINDNHSVSSSLRHEMEGAATNSCLDLNCITGTAEAALGATGLTALANGDSRTITHRPASAFLNMDRYAPLGFCQGITYIDITLCSKEMAMICASDNAGSGYEVSNFELHIPVLQPGPEFAGMFRSAMASGVPIQIHSVGVQNTQQTITSAVGGSETLTFSTRKRSVKSLVAAVRQNAALTKDLAPSVSCFLNAGITQYNWAVGGLRIPAQLIACSTSDKGELIANTQQALGYYNSDLRGVDCISALEDAKPVSLYYRSLSDDIAGKNSKCFFAIDLESYNASYAGKNLAGQGLPLVLHAQTGTGIQSVSAAIVDTFVIHDQMFVLEGQTGVMSVNS